MNAKLTPRQRQVAEMVQGGATTRQIATALGIALKSARNHRNRIGRKQRAGFLAGGDEP
jgi:FixJ family two-component response regulator